MNCGLGTRENVSYIVYGITRFTRKFTGHKPYHRAKYLAPIPVIHLNLQRVPQKKSLIKMTIQVL